MASGSKRGERGKDKKGMERLRGEGERKDMVRKQREVKEEGSG